MPYIFNGLEKHEKDTSSHSKYTGTTLLFVVTLGSYKLPKSEKIVFFKESASPF